MSKTKKFWTAVLAFIPFLMMIVYIVFVFSFMVKMVSLQEQGMPEPPMREIIGMISVAMLMAITSIIALVYFLVHVVNNKTLASDERLMWILIIIFANVIAFPIYWFMKINKLQQPPASHQDFSSQTIAK